MTQGTLTTRKIAALAPGEWASDPAARGAGRLQARRLRTGGVAWYYRYTAPDGQRVRQPLAHDLSLADARAEADKLARRFQEGARDLRETLVAEQKEAARQREAEQRASDAATTRASATLGALMTAYVEQLRRDGKASAEAVGSAVKRHIETPWSKLWARPAADVDTDDLLEVVARVVTAGKRREAAKLRSYIRAAYAAAISARHNATALPALRALKIAANPARDLATIEANTTPGERNLSIAELHAYWKRISAKGFRYGPLLQFHLLTGAQRLKMLERAVDADLDDDTQSFRLLDYKGRRKQPRQHDVPRILAAREALGRMRPERLGPHLFTMTSGETAATHSSMRDALAIVNTAMQEAGELQGGTFTAGDLRRTVETRLAAEGVSMEDRGHLQSHGLGGVQSRHYDRHKRLKETRAALESLHRIVTGKGAK
jgi:hypothetical protein